MSATDAELRAALRANRKARAELSDLVHQARRSGMSLRQIGAASGLSHETIRRVLDTIERGSA
jgi:lambda repressor-like predicted transcriptional regulator